jgi:hypothetical protein
MDAKHEVASISALEAATDAFMIALGRRPEPDLEGATAALKAREAALRYIVGAKPGTRPPDLNARLRRILDRDRDATTHMRDEMEALRLRIEETKQMMHSYRDGPVGVGRR